MRVLTGCNNDKNIKCGWFFTKATLLCTLCTLYVHGGIIREIHGVSPDRGSFGGEPAAGSLMDGGKACDICIRQGAHMHTS